MTNKKSWGNENVKRRISSAFALACAVYFALVPSLFAVSGDPEIRIQRIAHDATGPLSAAEIGEVKDLIDQNRLLTADNLKPATLDAIGKILLLAGADSDFQSNYLDDFSGQSLRQRVGIDISPEGFAVLADRIALASKAPEIYGALPSSYRTPITKEKELQIRSARNILGVSQVSEGKLGPIPSDTPLVLSRPSYPKNPTLRKELLILAEEDQNARREPEFHSEVEREAFFKHMEDVDSKTLPRINEIFAKYGFPDKALVGRSGTLAAFLLVQHAIKAPDLMRLAANRAEFLWKKGELANVHYALLRDRVACVIEHKPQEFGTQGTGFEQPVVLSDR